MPPELSSLATRFEAIPTDTLYDVLDEMGYGDRCCLSIDIKPLTTGKSLAGPVYPVRLVRDPRSVEEWNPERISSITERFAGVEAGDVILVDGGGDSSTGHWGEVLSRIAQRFGARGAVIEGGTRDSRGLAELDDWLTFARYTSPIESINRLRFHEVDVPLFLPGALGPVTVSPDDWIVADEDGVLVVPAAEFLPVLERAEAIEAADTAAKLGISSGEDIEEVYLRYRRA